MGECEYGKGEERVGYYDYGNQSLIPYECPRDSLPDKQHETDLEI
jgi:hypothetical protein